MLIGEIIEVETQGAAAGIVLQRAKGKRGLNHKEEGKAPHESEKNKGKVYYNVTMEKDSGR